MIGITKHAKIVNLIYHHKSDLQKQVTYFLVEILKNLFFCITMYTMYIKTEDFAQVHKNRIGGSGRS